MESESPPVAEAMIHEILRILRLDGPGTLPCGLSLYDGRSYRFHAGSEEFAHTIEYIQMAAGEGPVRDVVATGRALTLLDLRSDPRWPIFRIAAALHGLVSLHCEPLCGPDGHPIGTITWYSTRLGTFTDPLRRDLATCARTVAMTLRARYRPPEPIRGSLSLLRADEEADMAAAGAAREVRGFATAGSLASAAALP